MIKKQSDIGVWIEGETFISVKWHVADVRRLRPELDDEEAMEVLERAFSEPSEGMFEEAWRDLEEALDFFYPKEEE